MIKLKQSYHLIKRLGFIILSCQAILMMSSCVQSPKLNTTVTSQINPKTYSGRFSVKYLNSFQKTEQQQGAFEWSIININDTQPTMIIALKSILNTNLAILTSNPKEGFAQIETPKQTLKETNLNDLMLNHLGWVIPLELFIPLLKNNKNNDNATINNHQWQIAVINRYDSGAIKVLNANYPDKQLSVRLVFEE